MTRRIEQKEASELGLRMRQSRVALGLTLQQLAILCGGDHTRISKIERGQFCRLNSYVQQLCKHVHVDLESPGGASSKALHARLDSLISESPAAAAALQAVFDALDRMKN